MLRQILPLLLFQAFIRSGSSFDYFEAIDACLEGFPIFDGTLENRPGNRYTYNKCKEAVYEDPFCQTFCFMQEGAFRFRCERHYQAPTEERPCYISPTPVDYVYDLWTGVYAQDVPVSKTVLEKFKLKEGTTVAEARNLIYSSVEKIISRCDFNENLTMSTYDDSFVKCQSLPPNDKIELEKYVSCLENAWKTCGETIE